MWLSISQFRLLFLTVLRFRIINSRAQKFFRIVKYEVRINPTLISSHRWLTHRYSEFGIVRSVSDDVVLRRRDSQEVQVSRSAGTPQSLLGNGLIRIQHPDVLRTQQRVFCRKTDQDFKFGKRNSWMKSLLCLSSVCLSGVKHKCVSLLILKSICAQKDSDLM